MVSEGMGLTNRWYVLCCKPHKEQVVLQRLQHMGLEIYFPCSRLQNGRTGKLELRPYFPGYLFVRADLDQLSLSTFQWMPHTEGLVCFETRPAYVPDHLLLAMRQHVNDTLTSVPLQQQMNSDGTAGLDSELKDYDTFLNINLTSGERVSGLLKMLEGLSLPSASS